MDGGQSHVSMQKCFCVLLMSHKVLFLDAMNICRSEPTGHPPYALVFGQKPLHYFAMLEEWKLNNISMEENLPENVFEEIASNVNNYNEQDTTNDGQILCNVEQDCISVSSF